MTQGGKVKGKLANGVGSQYSHTTSEGGVSSITNADAHTSAAISRLNWRPRRFMWTRPFRRKTKFGFCACAITFQTYSTARSRDTRGNTLNIEWHVTNRPPTTDERTNWRRRLSRRPSDCLAIPALIASRGSVTDTLDCNCDSAYANECQVTFAPPGIWRCTSYLTASSVFLLGGPVGKYCRGH